jgi:hypothetical protein
MVQLHARWGRGMVCGHLSPTFNSIRRGGDVVLARMVDFLRTESGT